MISIHYFNNNRYNQEVPVQDAKSPYLFCSVCQDIWSKEVFDIVEENTDDKIVCTFLYFISVKLSY